MKIMKRLKLNSRQENVFIHSIFGVFLSTILLIICLLILLLWNGINYLLDHNWFISYSTLGYVYLVCWLAALTIGYFFIKSESKTSRGDKLWEHEQDRIYIADSIGDDYFDVWDPYGD